MTFRLRFWKLYRPALLRIIVAAILALIGLGGLWGARAGLFTSPQSKVRTALLGLEAPADAEIRFVVDIQSDPARIPKTAYHHLNFRAGPGSLQWPARGYPAIQFPFRVTFERTGMAVKFRGLYRSREGTSYINFSELPPLGDLPDLLIDRWLRMGESSAQPPERLPAEDAKRLVDHVLNSGAVLSLMREGSEDILERETRVYRLVFGDKELVRLLEELPRQFPARPAVRAVSQYLQTRLDSYRVGQLKLWLESRRAAIVRFRLELVPRQPENPVQRIVVDATIIPRTSVGVVPAAPSSSVQIKPESIQRLLGAGL